MDEEELLQAKMESSWFVNESVEGHTVEDWQASLQSSKDPPESRISDFQRQNLQLMEQLVKSVMEALVSLMNVVVAILTEF